MRSPKVGGVRSVVVAEEPKTMSCPVCKKKVRVGGPYRDQWHILRHSPGDDPSVSCLGTDEKISVKTSP